MSVGNRKTASPNLLPLQISWLYNNVTLFSCLLLTDRSHNYYRHLESFARTSFPNIDHIVVAKEQQYKEIVERKNCKNIVIEGGLCMPLCVI